MGKIIKLVEERQMCGLPWVHTELNFQSNTIQPCCKYNGSLGSISDGLNKVWNNSESNRLRTQWVNDGGASKCSACNVDDSSFSYKKVKNRAYLTYNDIYVDVDSDIIETPKVFSFSLSNTCNLACRMCGPRNSSKLTQLVKNNEPLKQFFHVQEYKNKIDLDSLKGSFKNAKLLNFTGGEPFLNDDTIRIIKMVRHESTNISSINFSSNLMTINYELLEELESIRLEMNTDISISISIDGPEKVNNYIRHYCDFNAMMRNLDFIRETYPNFIYSINSTISILNVGYIPEILDLIDTIASTKKINIKRVQLSPVLDKSYLHPGLLPDDIKSAYKVKLLSYDFKSKFRDDEFFISTALSLLNQTPNGSFKEFIEFSKTFDSAAKVNIVDVYPEFKSFF